MWRCWWVLGVRNPQSTACDVGAFVSRIKRKSLIIFLFLTWYCFSIHLYVTICMKLDPGMHIGMHLVFFEKSGVKGEGIGLLGSRCGSFFTRWRAGFISLPRQVRRFPWQYIIRGQPNQTTNLHVLLSRDLHLQAWPDNSHGRSA
jgi:hypothetical protein